MLSILCPTRKRPENIRRLLNSLWDTMPSHSTVEILAYVDEDDDSYSGEQFPICLVRGPRIVMSDMWNVLAGKARGDLMMMMGDDVVFRTPGWNGMVGEEFAKSEDKILLVHGDDGAPRGKEFATLPIVHRRWFEILGHFSGPGYSSDFADTHPNDIADMIGRRKYLPYVTEHMHWIHGKAEKDETYREAAERNERDNPSKLYQERLQERIIYAESLRRKLGTPWHPKVR
jgi:hypothetical protein